MTIEYVTKLKVESLSTIMPKVVSEVLLAPEDSKYILLTDEKVLSSYFVVAIVLDEHILWISDEDYRKTVEEYLKETN